MVELQLPKLMMGVRFSSPAQNRKSGRCLWTGMPQPPQDFLTTEKSSKGSKLLKWSLNQ